MWAVRVEAVGIAPSLFRLAPLVSSVELPALDFKPAARLSLRLVNSQGQPIVGAQVLATASESSGWTVADQVEISNTGGFAEILLRENEAADLTIVADGYAMKTVEHVPAGEKVISLDAAMGYRLRFDNEDQGNVPKGVYARAIGHGGTVASSDKSGEMQLFLRGDEQLILESTSGSCLQLAAADLDASKINRVVLPGRSVVYGEVLDFETRQPVAGALVWPVRKEDRFVQTNERGEYAWNRCLEQEWPLVAVAPGYSQARAVFRDTEDRQGPTLVLRSAEKNLTGRVVDWQGEPVVGVQIRLEMHLVSRVATSGSDGRYAFTGLPGLGTATLRANPEGFRRILRNVDVASAESDSLILVAEPLFEIRGQLRGNDGAPLPTAAVQLKSGNTEIAVGKTSDSGEFSFTSVAVDGGTLHVAEPGFAEIDYRFRAPRGELLDIGELRLEEEALLTGFVLDEVGQPAEGAEIFAWRTGSSVSYDGSGYPQQAVDAVSAADGSFTVRGLLPGTVLDLDVRCRGYFQKQLTGFAGPFDEPLALTLTRTTRIAGEVVDQKGRPVEHARVLAREIGEPEDPLPPLRRQLPPSTRTDEAGRFVLHDVRVGKVRLEATGFGFLKAESEFQAREDNVAEEVRLVLPAAAVVEGRVLDGSGDPAVLASIRTFALSEQEWAERNLHYESTDGDGYFRIQGVRPGTQLIEVNLVDHPRLLQRIEVQPGDNWIDLQLDSQELQDVFGYVVDQDGTPLSGVALTLTAHGRPIVPRQTQTHVDGSFAFSEVAAAGYLLYADFEGYLQPQLEVQVTVGMDELTLELIRAASLSGRISGLTIPELRRLQLALTRDNGETSGARVHEDGTFESASLLPGIWTLTAILLGASDWPAVEETVVIDHAGQEVRVDLSFP